MAMDPEVEAKVEESVVALTDLFRKKQIAPQDYYKGMLCLAYEYSVAEDNLRAAAIAQGIPREYYLLAQRQQMTEDPLYAYISYTLALNLLQAGYVNLAGSGPAPNLPTASA